MGCALTARTRPNEAPALEKQLDDGGGEPHLDALVQQLVGDAVVVVLDDDVVVDVNAGVAPRGKAFGVSSPRNHRNRAGSYAVQEPSDS